MFSSGVMRFTIMVLLLPLVTMCTNSIVSPETIAEPLGSISLSVAKPIEAPEPCRIETEDLTIYGRLVDALLRGTIAEQGLIGDPSVGRDLPSINDPLAQLGKKFFFTKALGGDKDSACVTCHLPTLGGGDGLALSIGAGAHVADLLGPGRTHPSGGPTVPRNAPTTFNIAMWDQALFHDGRVESLGKTVKMEGADGLGIRTPDVALGTADPAAGANLTIAQCRFPVTSEDEMRGFLFEAGSGNDEVRDHLAARLGDYGAGANELEVNTWQSECESVFPQFGVDELMITFDLITEAIGTYERSQVFVDTPWKAYVEGDRDAISLDAKKGAMLFFQAVEQGGGGCADCHSGDFFTDEEYYALGIPQIGRGKGDGATGDDDFGRYRETLDPNDLYAFRTPTLLNVEVTGPYGHDGAYATLEGIVRHHLNPDRAVDSYDDSQLEASVQRANMEENTRKALAQIERVRSMGLTAVEPTDLSEKQVGYLVEFLKTLTDPCVEDVACLAPWMPAEGETDPDGLRVVVSVAPNE